jgi:hypothetical protein
MLRHPEVPSRSGGLEGRRPAILRGALRAHLSMTVRELSSDHHVAFLMAKLLM